MSNRLSRRMFAFAAVAGLAALTFAPVARAAEPVVVFAAASLKNALDNATGEWTAKGGTAPVISYAGSSALAKQIAEGAPADMFISASPDWMDDLDGKGLIDKATRSDFLGNTLVLVGPAGASPEQIGPDFDLSGKIGDGKLAMALVDSVPAGVYGKAALTSLGLWQSVEPKVAQADNVRAALALVARGEAPYGIVYSTDAAADKSVSIVGTFPAGSHPPIIYPVALTAASKNADAPKFLDWLKSPEAAHFFTEQGFVVLK